MKKIVLVITFIFSLAAVAFANEEKIKPEVLDAFNNKFSSAQDVTWVAGNNYFKASFHYYGSSMSAWYTPGGKLMGVTRYMISTELPLYLRNTLKEKYTHYWISNVVEESNKNGFSYYITIENADTKLVLKSKSGGDWTIYSKQQKS